MADVCLVCAKVVRPRQHGIACDLCERWQHRICGTGISREQYLRACKGDPLNFVCSECSVPRHNSSVLELHTEHLPEDFFKADLRIAGRRHLIFATDHQLDLLKQSKTWYMDGTFKAMRKPFEMLFTIHTFVRRGTVAKQVPLIYILMTGKRTVDYQKVLRKIKRVLQPDNLRRIVIDFEAAIWSACRTTFPDMDIQGCGFHWGQVVFRHVQSLGLTTEYLNHTGSYSFIRQLLCLPLLPHEHIVPTFEAMRDFNTAPHLEPLLSYIDRTWMRSTVWPVQSWSVFGKVVRTNNDVEGWHRRLNTRTGTAPPFYQLIQTLFMRVRRLIMRSTWCLNSELRSLKEKTTRQYKTIYYEHGQTTKMESSQPQVC